MRMRVADYIAERLEGIGVRTIFLLSGGGMMHLLDAAACRKGLKIVCSHHEQASSFAAEAYARQSGGLGVCYATSGPGGTNTLTGVLHAWQDSSPVLFISGQCKVSETIRHTGLFGLRQFGTLEVDIVPIVQSVTKYAAFVDDPAKIRYHLEKAIHLATSGRPGPVFLDIPVNIQGAPIDPDMLEGYVPERHAPPAAPEPEIAEALRLLSRAERPLLLAGHGIRCAGRAEAFRSFAERLNVPVVLTQMAKDLLPFDHPLFVGHPGIKGDRAGNFAIQRADVLLTLGASLHVTTTGYELDQFAPKAFKIQVDLDEPTLRREKVGVQRKIRCSVELFLETADLAARPVESSLWHAVCAGWKRDFAVSKEPHRREGDSINYYDLIESINDLTNGSETIVGDAGSAYYVIGQGLRVKGSQRVIVCGALGTMGYTVPAATGICSADPRVRVVGVTGDGSLQTNVHELAVLSCHRLNAKIFVVNNGGYVSIRNTQRNYFSGRIAGTDEGSGVKFPDLAKLCEAYSLPYVAARSRSGLRDAVARTLAAEGPVVCEVFALSDQAIIPTITSVRLENGSMRSRPLHDMFPLIEPSRLAAILEGRLEAQEAGR